MRATGLDEYPWAVKVQNIFRFIVSCYWNYLFRTILSHYLISGVFRFLQAFNSHWSLLTLGLFNAACRLQIRMIAYVFQSHPILRSHTRSHCRRAGLADRRSLQNVFLWHSTVCPRLSAWAWLHRRDTEQKKHWWLCISRLRFNNIQNKRWTQTIYAPHQYHYEEQRGSACSPHA